MGKGSAAVAFKRGSEAQGEAGPAPQHLGDGNGLLRQWGAVTRGATEGDAFGMALGAGGEGRQAGERWQGL